MPRYRVDGKKTQVMVKARSSVHDTVAVFSSASGEINADPSDLESSELSASISLDMTAFDAGDWLKNRKIKKDLEVDRHPEATFELTGLRNVSSEADRFEASALGKLSWRGRVVEIEAIGSGTVDENSIEANASFDLDVTRLGVTPPRFLMFKVEETVTIDVVLRAVAS